jgi:mRNA interferase HigB
MRIFALKTLSKFWNTHNDSEHQLRTWFKEASKANWASPADIKSEYPKASILKDRKVVFNICGNSYRLIVRINYERGWIFILFIGTHIEYDKIDIDKL